MNLFIEKACEVRRQADGVMAVSGAHPAARQTVKEADTESEDIPPPWYLKEVETQLAALATTYHRALPLPAAAIFSSEKHGELQEVNMFYWEQELHKMGYTGKQRWPSE